jgi:hypothetical protein
MSTKVVISPRPIKTSETIDRAGNIINARTKQIIQPKEPDYVPPVAQSIIETPTIPSGSIPREAVQPHIYNSMTQIDPLSIQAQIDAVKDNLKQLEELKKLKIQEMKETIKILKNK